MSDSLTREDTINVQKRLTHRPAVEGSSGKAWGRRFLVLEPSSLKGSAEDGSECDVLRVVPGVLLLDAQAPIVVLLAKGYYPQQQGIASYIK